MALSGSSTLADAKAQYLNNLRYQTEKSAAKCADFIEACEALLLLMPQRVRRGRGNEVEMDVRLIKDRLEQAQRWLASRGSSGGAVTHVSFENFRQ